ATVFALPEAPVVRIVLLLLRRKVICFGSAEEAPWAPRRCANSCCFCSSVTTSSALLCGRPASFIWVMSKSAGMPMLSASVLTVVSTILNLSPTYPAAHELHCLSQTEIGRAHV